MNVPLNDNKMHGAPFNTSETCFDDMGDFNDFNAMDELDEQQISSSYSRDMSRGGSIALERAFFDDVAISPTDQAATSASTDSERSPDSNTKMRRRAQNRASQRAFRERKERHLRGLKANLETLGDKHRKLVGSYSQQSEAAMVLKGRIAELHAQIAAFSVQPEREQVSFLSEPQKGYHPEFQQFDAFSFSSRPSDNQDLKFWQIQNRDSTQVDMSKLPASGHLPGFEDLLSLP